MKYIMTTLLLLLSGASLAVDGKAGSQEFVDATANVCEKLKSCSLAQLQAQNLPPEYMAMMQPMMGEMCSQMLSQFEVALTSHKYYRPSLVCLKSIESMSCTEILNSVDNITPECNAFRQLVNEQ